MLTFTNLGKLGRLGNQMFQIASTIGISRWVGTGCCFPEWKYQHFFTKRLQEMVIVPQVTGDEGMLDYRDMRMIIDTEQPIGININLNGYFQSHLYFDHCRKEVLSYFNLKQDHLDYIFDKYPDIENKNSIHVRRGDYLTLQQFHPIQSLEYYKNGMDYIDSSEEYCVFSDDREWCKENFKGSKYIFIEEEDVTELFMMSLCKNNITANSSFSWWAAYLNKNSNKKVVAPSNWFSRERILQAYHDKDNYLKHRIPSAWKII